MILLPHTGAHQEGLRASLLDAYNCPPREEQDVAVGDKYGRLSAYCVKDYKMQDDFSLNIWLWLQVLLLHWILRSVGSMQITLAAHLGHS